MAPPRRRHVLNAHLGNEHESYYEGARCRRVKRERGVVGRASQEERTEKSYFVTEFWKVRCTSRSHGSVARPAENVTQEGDTEVSKVALAKDVWFWSICSGSEQTWRLHGGAM